MRSNERTPEGAAARLTVLALLADGDFGVTEIGLLERLRAFDVLAIGRSEFLDVAAAFCTELRGDAPAREARPYLSVDAHRIRRLLARIDDPATRRAIACLILQIVRADGRICAGESLLLWEMLDAWDLRLADVAALTLGAGAPGVLPRAPRMSRRPPRVAGPRHAIGAPAI
ncbi:MAG: hypothetical protein JNM90_10740 [Burkholderiales bacterium]|nr:hypothetical protein [Burkholderiales bacterium]